MFKILLHGTLLGMKLNLEILESGVMIKNMSGIRSNHCDHILQITNSGHVILNHRACISPALCFYELR